MRDTRLDATKSLVTHELTDTPLCCRCRSCESRFSWAPRLCVRSGPSVRSGSPQKRFSSCCCRELTAGATVLSSVFLCCFSLLSGHKPVCASTQVTSSFSSGFGSASFHVLPSLISLICCCFKSEETRRQLSRAFDDTPVRHLSLPLYCKVKPTRGTQMRGVFSQIYLKGPQWFLWCRLLLKSPAAQFIWTHLPLKAFPVYHNSICAVVLSRLRL